MLKINAIGRMFYQKPNSLGEGLSRIKSKLGAVGDDLIQMPGKRYYAHKSNKAHISIDTSNLTVRASSGDVTNISRLTLGTHNPKINYVVDYSACDLLGLGKPVKHRQVSKVQTLLTKMISNPLGILKSGS